MLHLISDSLDDGVTVGRISKKPMKAITILLLGAVMIFANGQPVLAESSSNKGEVQGQAKSGKRTVKRYPFDDCLVSNDKLGSLGKPIGFAYKGQEIKVCCRDCKNDFDKTPDVYMKRFEKKIAEIKKR